MRFANDAYARLNPEQREQFQLNRLLSQIDYCYRSSQFYRDRFAAVGLDPRDIATLADYRAAPILMDKEQERVAQAISPRLAERIRKAMSHTLKVGPAIEWLTPGGLDKPLAKTPLFVKNY